MRLKFTFSKKVTKIDKIFTVNLIVCSNRQIDSEEFVLTLSSSSMEVLFIRITWVGQPVERQNFLGHAVLVLGAARANLA